VPAPTPGAKSGRTSSTASAGRRQVAPTATGPAPLEATTWRIRRIIAALLGKAAATSFPHEAAACREKAEALRAEYGLQAASSKFCP
jgi:hypothetical protein